MPLKTIILRSTVVDPELTWRTPKAFIEALPRYLTGQIEGSEDLFLLNYGFDTPTVDGQGYPWLRVDEFGKPMGTFVYYNGAWVKDWGLAIGDLKPYTGDLVNIPDGFIHCDGTGGSPDLTSLSIAGSGIDYDITWIQYVGYA